MTQLIVGPLSKLNQNSWLCFLSCLASSLLKQGPCEPASGVRGVPVEPEELTAILEEQILRYLQAHPRAADSREGIERFWLQGAGASMDPDAVQQALDGLVERGLLRRNEVAGGKLVYGAILGED